MTTRIKDSLPELNLKSTSTLTVDTTDVNAIVTGMTIHVSEDFPQTPETAPTFVSAFAYAPGEA